jgi:hypothetical protein
LTQSAALIGFGQIYISKTFLTVFNEELRFWYSLFYLIVAATSVLVSNLYLFFAKKEPSKGVLFSGAMTAPTFILSLFSVSLYIYDIEIPMNFFPRIPMSLVYLAITLALGLLTTGMVLSIEPNFLHKLRFRRSIRVNKDELVEPVVKEPYKTDNVTRRNPPTTGKGRDLRYGVLVETMMQFSEFLSEKEAEGYDVKEFKLRGRAIVESFREGDLEGASKLLNEAIERLKTLGPEILGTLRARITPVDWYRRFLTSKSDILSLRKGIPVPPALFDSICGSYRFWSDIYQQNFSNCL